LIDCRATTAAADNVQLRCRQWLGVLHIADAGLMRMLGDCLPFAFCAQKAYRGGAELQGSPLNRGLLL
jgi:hypothetical protein